MNRLGPIVRLSIGLALLSISILLAADWIFGFSRAESEITLDARKKLCETLAVQFSLLAEKDDLETIRRAMQALTVRNDDILSTALRDRSGNLMVSVGDHEQHWGGDAGNESTSTHAQVPIFYGTHPWGKLEVRFTPLGAGSFLQILTNPLIQLVLFLGFIGFGVYLVFLKRTLAHLDPTSVIPGRVKLALNALSEGVVLMDENGRIVLANSAFGDRVGEPSDQLLGRKLSELDWGIPGSPWSAPSLPWNEVMLDGQNQTGVAMTLSNGKDAKRTFMVNASPILDHDGNRRGALATFDDVTELEKKNEELREMLEMLQSSRGEVRRQNEMLKVLATRDTLTSCLNRRSFFEQLEREVNTARKDEQPLSCIMTDIDHFKSINDNYGHAAGDQVIREVAEILRSGLRSIDLLGRYGGEEFCILLPGVNAEKAMEITERLRRLVETKFGDEGGSTFGRPVTLSFGISSLEFGPTSPSELVDQADKALYASKNSGRNCVTCWSDIEEDGVAFG